MKYLTSSFRAWVIACNAAIPIFAVIVILRVIPFHNRILSWAAWIAMAILICLGVAGAILGLLMCFGRLRMRCPFCGGIGIPDAGVQGSRPHVCMDCPKCGRIETSGRFFWRIRKAAPAASTPTSRQAATRIADTQRHSGETTKGFRKILAILSTDWGHSHWGNYPFSQASILSGIFSYLFIAAWLIVAIMAGLGHSPSNAFVAVIVPLFVGLLISRSFDNRRAGWKLPQARNAAALSRSFNLIVGGAVAALAIVALVVWMLRSHR